MKRAHEAHHHFLDQRVRCDKDRAALPIQLRLCTPDVGRWHPLQVSRQNFERECKWWYCRSGSLR